MYTEPDKAVRKSHLRPINTEPFNSIKHPGNEDVNINLPTDVINVEGGGGSFIGGIYHHPPPSIICKHDKA
jgi:hypothetical protein